MPEVVGNGADAFLEANRQLIEVAEELDRQEVATDDSTTVDTSEAQDAPATSVSPVKAEQTAFGPLAALFFAFGLVWIYPAGIASAIAWVLALVNLIF